MVHVPLPAPPETDKVVACVLQATGVALEVCSEACLPSLLMAASPGLSQLLTYSVLHSASQLAQQLPDDLTSPAGWNMNKVCCLRAAVPLLTTLPQLRVNVLARASQECLPNKHALVSGSSPESALFSYSLPLISATALQGGRIEVGAPTGKWQLIVIYRGKHCPVSRSALHMPCDHAGMPACPHCSTWPM